jgi:hypothetical protein
VKFIRRAKVRREEREKHFLFPTQEMGSKTPFPFLYIYIHVYICVYILNLLSCWGSYFAF